MEETQQQTRYKVGDRLLMSAVHGYAAKGTLPGKGDQDKETMASSCRMCPGCQTCMPTVYRFQNQALEIGRDGWSLHTFCACKCSWLCDMQNFYSLICAVCLASFTTSS